MKLSILIDIPTEFQKEAIYTFENIFFPYSEKISFVDDINNFINKQHKIIYCQFSSKLLRNCAIIENALIIIFQDSTLRYFSSFNEYDVNRVEWKNSVPCLFPIENQITLGNNSCVLSFDVIAASFFFLSCWQEYTTKERDNRGRVPLKSTLQYKLNINRKPIVNLYMDIISNHTQQLWKNNLEKKTMPRGESNTYVALTHDVDFIQYSFFKFIKGLFSIRKYLTFSIYNLFFLFRNIIGQKYIFHLIDKIESEKNINSTHYFLSEYASKYKVCINKYIKILLEKKNEIGHHISEKSIFNTNLIEDKKLIQSLNTNIVGSRVHMLEFEVQILYKQLEEQNYLYDSSLIFPEDISYRTGFTYPHYIFNITNRCPFNVVSIPLNIMDITANKYLCMNDNEFERELYLFFETAVEMGGVITLLFHNTYFFYNTESRKKMYKNILSYFINNNIPVGTCKELYLWRINKDISPS